MNQTLAIARKELKAYFGSPMAAIFIGAFLLSALFSFFWVETFFARNIADIRPLFRWMPLLMIFLVSSLTMRQWSEEQKMGTIEILFTLPVSLTSLVLGKFLAVLSLVTIALALTFGLPVTVSFLGNMDWGPVAGGYLGALLMASSYIAIGLFVSSRTDNQIIALILTVLLAGLLYLLGSSGITNFMGNQTGEILRLVGTGSRFQSIERGVIDFRDLIYYGSLTIFFLSLNIFSLDQKRWSSGRLSSSIRRNAYVTALFTALNLLALNLWISPLQVFRLDLTEQKDYSISDSTRDLISHLEEPLTLRGYFSDKTHPLLAPLVPKIKDFMEEYEIASGGRVSVSFVDPKYDEEKEAEANEQFGIKPVPFQVKGRYEASVVNSYFNILIKYGDQYATMGFEDLIEIQPKKDGQLDVGLRNLEYDLTRSIKKVVSGFQGLDSVFENVSTDIIITAIITPASLPDSLSEIPAAIAKIGADLNRESGGKIKFQKIDPDNTAAGGRDEVNRLYGIEPQLASIFSGDTFYLYLFLSMGDRVEKIFLAEDMGEAEIRREIEAALKRSSSGFLKTVGLWTPGADPLPTQMGRQMPEQDSFQVIRETLRENYNLSKLDLTDGRVPGNIDVLLLVSPQGMTDMERFAVDQHLMRGGAVVVLAGSHVLDIQPYSESLSVKRVENGLAEQLGHYGIEIGESLVMDLQNEPFPIPVIRNLGGLVIQEIRHIDYPFFVDIRKDGMAQESPIVANLPAVTLNWASPLILDQEGNKDRTVFRLLQSSDDSWLYSGSDIMPDFRVYPDFGFAEGDSLERQTLAVSVLGSFKSYFSRQPDPRLNAHDEISEEQLSETATINHEKKPPPLEPLIKKSPDSARLVVVGSSEFINDAVINISRSMGQDRFMNSLELLQNIIDWSVEDESLLAIRSGGSHARILESLTRKEQRFWEWLNYGLAFSALLFISFYGGLRRKKETPIQLDESV